MAAATITSKMVIASGAANLGSLGGAIIILQDLHVSFGNCVFRLSDFPRRQSALRCA